ncbi:MAG: hypothetical protein AB7E61_07135 [Acholeplasmataceae bacterium]
MIKLFYILLEPGIKTHVRLGNKIFKLPKVWHVAKISKPKHVIAKNQEIAEEIIRRSLDKKTNYTGFIVIKSVKLKGKGVN